MTKQTSEPFDWDRFQAMKQWFAQTYAVSISKAWEEAFLDLFDEHDADFDEIFRFCQWYNQNAQDLGKWQASKICSWLQLYRNRNVTSAGPKSSYQEEAAIIEDLLEKCKKEFFTSDMQDRELQRSSSRGWMKLARVLKYYRKMEMMC